MTAATGRSVPNAIDNTANKGSVLFTMPQPSMTCQPVRHEMIDSSVANIGGATVGCNQSMVMDTEPSSIMQTAQRPVCNDRSNNEFGQKKHSTTTRILRLMMLGSCLGSSSPDSQRDRQQKQVDESISKRMKANKKEYEHTYRLLLLGSGESGKSTIVKQMQILHKQGFTTDERRRKLADIHRNILDSIVSMTKAMSELVPPGSLENEAENRDLVEYVHAVAEIVNFDYPDAFFEKVKRLWSDDGVQQVYHRSNEYQLIDCAKYFLDNIDRIRSPDFLPTDQDILWCRSQTTGIHQVRFVMDKVHFHLFDVGGQRYERRRWCQCFHGITAILFVTAMSDYNLVLAEDQTENRLKESVKLFEEDLLEDKICSKQAALRDYFPEFENYCSAKSSSFNAVNSSNQQPPLLATGTPTTRDMNNTSTNSGGVCCNEEAEEVLMAKMFIRDLFLSVRSLNTEGLNTATASIRQCYAHYTCAVDTENIRRIFNDVKNTIQIINLKNYELI